MASQTISFDNFSNEQISLIFQEEILKNIKREFKFSIKEGKPLKSEHMLVKGDPEPYTRRLIEPQIKKFLPQIDFHSEIHKVTSLGNLRKPDGFIPSRDIKLNRNILIEWEPYNEDLRSKRDHGINQAKLWISDINIGSKNDALVTNGREWILITTREVKNEIRVVERDLTVKQALKFMNNVYNAEKVYEFPTEEAIDITEKFYKWYVALIHGGEYHDKENKRKFISKEDCLIKNVLNTSSEREKEDFIRINFTRLIFIRILTEYGIIKEDILNYLKNVEPEDFYNRINQLYFESLNSPLYERENIPKAYQTIPFLNGGLFHKKQIENKGIIIRRKSFIEAIQFLRTFHFKKEYENLNGSYIIDNTIDPEILGHILEKTVEDRKQSGVYYTPQIITEFMSKEIIEKYLMRRIIDYLKDKNDSQWKHIEHFNDIFQLQNIKLVKIYEKFIKPLKICDPAVGSGAFLLNCGSKLFQLQKKIHKKIEISATDYEIKKNIIQDNLYGVDIKDAAVDICKLRLWLWVIQKQEQEPLPNIEFNIRKGNSLIGYTNTDTIKIDITDISSWETKADLTDLFEKRNILIKKYYTTQNVFEQRRLKKEIDQITQSFNSKLRYALENELIKGGVKLKEDNASDIDFFHWIMEFSEVFEKNNGFDIIIGNPPYFRITFAPKIEQKVIGKLGILKDYHHGQGDIYYDFIVRCFELLREKGQLIFITSRYWLEAAYANYLKKFFKQKVKILNLFDFREQLIFKGVDIHNSILHYEKKQPNKLGYDFGVYLFNEESFNKEKKLGVKDYLSYVGNYNINEWSENENWAFVPKRHRELFLKIKNIKTRLGDDYNCNQFTNSFRKKCKSILIFKNKPKDIPETFIRKYLKMGEVNKYSPDFEQIKFSLVIHNKQLDLKNKELRKFLSKSKILDKDLYEIKKSSEKNVDKFDDLIYIGYRIPRLSYNFTYVNDQTWIDNTYFITKKKMTGFSLEYLIAVLNSDLMRYYIDIVGKKKENEIEIGSNFLKNLPIILKRASLTKTQLNNIGDIENNVTKIIEEEKKGKDIREYEKILNNLIYCVYNINKEEQTLIGNYKNEMQLKLWG